MSIIENYLDEQIRILEVRENHLMKELVAVKVSMDANKEKMEELREARAIFLTYRVGNETRERFKRMGVDRFDPPIDK